MIKNFLLLFFLIGFSVTSFGQPGYGTLDGGDAPGAAPIDGGLIILAVSGAIYSFRKLNSKS